MAQLAQLNNHALAITNQYSNQFANALNYNNLLANLPPMSLQAFSALSAASMPQMLMNNNRMVQQNNINESVQTVDHKLAGMLNPGIFASIAQQQQMSAEQPSPKQTVSPVQRQAILMYEQMVRQMIGASQNGGPASSTASSLAGTPPSTNDSPKLI